MERVPLHDREMEISIQYHVMQIHQSNDQILMRCYIMLSIALSLQTNHACFAVSIRKWVIVRNMWKHRYGGILTIDMILTHRIDFRCL